MGKIGGGRNYGYGKRMAWAGKNALADRYGEGHYGTRASHAERWAQFAAYADGQGIKDARQVTSYLIAEYGAALQEKVQAGEMAVSYAQNLLSTVNVVLEVMRGDRVLHVAPAELVGQRTYIRETAPAGLDRETVARAGQELMERGEARVTAIIGLARELGLRFREASLIDARTALKQAREQGLCNITQGTKGGRGREVNRWVPVTSRAMNCLERAATVQGDNRNLVPQELSYSQWRDHAYHVWSTVSAEHGLKGFHDLRAAYACNRYEQLTGKEAPVVAGQREADKRSDAVARQIISRELGHERVDVVRSYIGSAR